jgi:hypothetical protein
MGDEEQGQGKQERAPEFTVESAEQCQSCALNLTPVS